MLWRSLGKLVPVYLLRSVIHPISAWGLALCFYRSLACLLSCLDVDSVMLACFVFGFFWRHNSAAFATPLPLVNLWSSSVGTSEPPYMHDYCLCGALGCQISCCLALVWTAWCWIVFSWGVFRNYNSDVVTTQLLSVNLWSRLRVARVLGRMSGDVAVASTIDGNYPFSVTTK